MSRRGFLGITVAGRSGNLRKSFDRSLSMNDKDDRGVATVDRGVTKVDRGVVNVDRGVAKVVPSPSEEED